MTDDTLTTTIAQFEITSFDDTIYDDPADGPTLSRATIGKRFSGGLEGTSVTEMLAAGSDDGRGYVASERVTGTLDGRAGTFVLQHGGIDDGGELTPFGSIVPGSGTGELRGLRGEVRYVHDESGARITLTYSLR
jgi:Protein of unknown function (DUF3224)